MRAKQMLAGLALFVCGTLLSGCYVYGHGSHGGFAVGVPGPVVAPAYVAPAPVVRYHHGPRYHRRHYRRHHGHCW